MALILYYFLLISLPVTFIWSFFFLKSWRHFRWYVAINILLLLIYTPIIKYMCRNDLDGWGVAIFSIMAYYGHFVIAILTALTIKFVYIDRNNLW